MKQPKYIAVLEYLAQANSRGILPGYERFQELIYDEETIKKYSHARRHKVIIHTMVCGYMGKLARKGWLRAEYKKGYFLGYQIFDAGRAVLADYKAKQQ